MTLNGLFQFLKGIPMLYPTFSDYSSAFTKKIFKLYIICSLLYYLRICETNNIWRLKDSIKQLMFSILVEKTQIMPSTKLVKRVIFYVK